MGARTWWQLATAWALAFLMTSCGGGGGGGDDGGLRVSVSKSSVRLAGFLGGPAPYDSVNVTLSGGGSGSYYAGAYSDRPDLLQIGFAASSDTTGVFTVRPTLSAGAVASGTLTLMACHDIGCTRRAWSQTIPYTIQVYELSQTSLQVSGHEGIASPPMTLNISPPDTGRVLQLRAQAPAPGWLAISRSSDAAFSLNASALGLTAGSYASTLQVSFTDPALAGTMQSIPITLNVGSSIIVPPARTLELTRTTAEASLTGQANVAFQGSFAPAWSASSDQPWLVLSNTSGSGPGSISYRVDTSHLGGIANWQTGVARVRFSAVGLSDAIFEVSLDKRLPEVQTALPYSLAAGRINTLRVRGRGFDQLTSGAQFQVGALSGVTSAILSDTEAVITMPAMSAGTVAISVPNVAGLPTAAVEVPVISTAPPLYAVVPTSGEKRSAVFDAVRNAVYAINTTHSTLERFRYNGAQWQTASLPIASIGDLGFSPDHRTLYVTSGNSTLLAIDPDSLQVLRTHTLNLSDSIASSLAPTWGTTLGLPVTNNQRIWFTHGGWSSVFYFDMRTETFAAYPSSGVPGGLLYSSQFFSSGDGSRLLGAQYGISPAPLNLLYGSGEDRFSRLADLPPLVGFASLNDDGTKIATNVDGHHAVYSVDNGNRLGRISASGFGMHALLSPNGSVAYVMSGDTTVQGIQASGIEVFDTTRLRTDIPGSFERLGTIALPDQATSCGSNPPYGCSVVGTLIASPLNNALFWIGNRALVVIPIPSGMAQASGSSSRLRPMAR